MLTMAASAASAWAPHAQAWVATSSRLISKGVAFRTERSDVSFECACSCSQAEPEDYSRSVLQLWNVRRGHRSRGLQQMQAARLDGFSFSSRETNESKEVVGRSFLSESVSSDLLATFKLVENILYAESSNAEVADDGRKQLILRCLKAALPLFASLPAILGFESSAYARDLGHLNPAYGEVGAFLELGVQLIYLGLLLLFLGVGTFLVVRQVLVRRELETAAKELQERVRTGEASSEEYYELGAIFLRKKLFTQANKYLEQAIKKWDGDDQDLAQVYNALGFSCYSDDDVDGAIVQYLKAVKLQPGYVTAWNNLGDAYEKKKEYKSALKAYQEALQFDPSNKIASTRRDAVKKRVDMFQGIPD